MCCKVKFGPLDVGVEVFFLNSNKNSTLNRTAASYLAAIVLGEYILGLVPPKTHDWDKFVTPEELSAMFGEQGMYFDTLQGLVYQPWRPPYWRLSNMLKDVNYIASLRHQQ